MRLTLNLFSRGKKTRGKKADKARRPRMSKMRQRLITGSVGVVAIAAVGLTGWQLTESGWTGRAWTQILDGALRGSAGAGLSVAEVVVEGRTHTSSADLLAALGIERGSPILSVDLAAARARVEALGWVSHAIVARRLPDVVYLRIEERVPLALWQRKGALYLVDRDGSVIQKQNVEAFAGLPLIVGDDAPQHAADLLDLMTDYPEIASQLDAAIRVSDRRWNLRLTSGIDIRLPETGVAPALGRLADMHRTEKLLDRDVISVDLRKPDRLIVRGTPGARERGLDGKNT